MNIPMIINNEKILVQSAADASLLSVLRKQRLVQVKRGCELGICGSCTVLMNDKPVPSCKIPVALAMNKEIITLEHFMKDEMYISIMIYKSRNKTVWLLQFRENFCSKSNSFYICAPYTRKNSRIHSKSFSLLYRPGYTDKRHSLRV